MTTTTEPKWYNNETKFWLSIIFFPLFVYAFYMTNLFSTKKKWVMGSIAVIAAILINGFGKSSESDDEICYCKENIYGVVVIGMITKKKCKERNGEMVSFEEYLDYKGIK
jgi:hypothetical protein